MIMKCIYWPPSYQPVAVGGDTIASPVTSFAVQNPVWLNTPRKGEYTLETTDLKSFTVYS